MNGPNNCRPKGKNRNEIGGEPFKSPLRIRNVIIDFFLLSCFFEWKFSLHEHFGNYGFCFQCDGWLSVTKTQEARQNHWKFKRWTTTWSKLNKQSKRVLKKHNQRQYSQSKKWNYLTILFLNWFIDLYKPI